MPDVCPAPNRSRTHVCLVAACAPKLAPGEFLTPLVLNLQAIPDTLLD